MSAVAHANLILARVPAEIWDFILGPLQGDGSTLHACALTCNAWLFAARMYLFRTVRLTRKSTADFRSFVDKTPAIGYCVRTLQLEIDADPDFALLKHMPYVAKLTLTEWLLRHTVNDALTDYLGRIEALELRNCNMLVPELPRLLAACHELASLSLREVYWPLEVLDVGIRRRPLRKLPDNLPVGAPLRVQGTSIADCAQFVYRFLARSTALVPSPHLALQLPAPIETGELLKRWGSTLTHFRLTVGYIKEEEGGPDRLTPCSLADNPELCSLTIKQKHANGLHKWIIDMLKTIRSPHFRELKIIAPAERQKCWQKALGALVTSDGHCHADYLAFTIELHYCTKDPPEHLQKYVDDTLALEKPPGVDFNVTTVADPEPAPSPPHAY
ncbi:hypothetical protein FOMPIDRAFT_1063225 [Fomitopsis schrenkii]|uniref:F-box domain-containing protein n=1 Tax=Fomitopsis schrenkii TaxID=2126942 RepID=S8EXQ0_FOMSC|nr:hypothetical protein FOMPIDRAFT_1063225 [Fomitopsis schrenkii]